MSDTTKMASQRQVGMASPGELLARVRKINPINVVVNAFLNATGLEKPLRGDLEPEFLALYEQAKPFTMTSIERMYALWQAVRYLVAKGITGAVVECGVWRGGSSLMAALTLTQAGDLARSLYLFDTFEGMTAPTARDLVHTTGEAASDRLASAPRVAGAWNIWAYAPLDGVKQTMALARYPHVEYVRGPVETTLPDRAPEQIALLRLDTDWYESTLHELTHLYPRLAPGGVLIIDDYGYFDGARQAVDEYFADDPVLLQRIDDNGRLLVKPS